MEHLVNKRFREFVEYINVQPTRLAADIGIHYESVNRLFRHENKEIAPSTKILAGLKNRYPELSMEWIFAGTGNMIVKDDPSLEHGREARGQILESVSENNKLLNEIRSAQIDTHDFYKPFVQQVSIKDIIISDLSSVIKSQQETIKELRTKLTDATTQNP